MAWIDFHPHPLCFHPHLMTVLPRFRSRQWLLQGIPTEARLFAVTTDTKILAYCHWQPERERCRTLLLVHGFEGCSDSHYMVGVASKAWRTGLNVIRLNQRNCGGTEHLTPTLYHSGLSEDFASVVSELAAKDGLNDIWLAGFSMGGNLALKMAGELGATQPALRGIVAVCPNIDPAACVDALQRPDNWFYQHYFLTHTKARLRRKTVYFPGKFDLSMLDEIRTLREFDDCYTAPDGGFQNAADYYERVGARHALETIEVPTLLIAAQDDPFIPFRIFDVPAVRTHHWLRLITPKHGGHCGFFQRPNRVEDAYWAENRLLDFVASGGATGR